MLLWDVICVLSPLTAPNRKVTTFRSSLEEDVTPTRLLGGKRLCPLFLVNIWTQDQVTNFVYVSHFVGVQRDVWITTSVLLAYMNLCTMDMRCDAYISVSIVVMCRKMGGSPSPRVAEGCVDFYCEKMLRDAWMPVFVLWWWRRMNELPSLWESRRVLESLHLYGYI